MWSNFPSPVTVCSCTTDGFLSNASEEQIREATSGVLSRQYLQAHRYFNPEKEFILESKSVIQQPMGWRTRGQATLLPTEAVGYGTTDICGQQKTHPPMTRMGFWNDRDGFKRSTSYKGYLPQWWLWVWRGFGCL